jgi:hypothetical protein
VEKSIVDAGTDDATIGIPRPQRSVVLFVRDRDGSIRKRRIASIFFRLLWKTAIVLVLILLCIASAFSERADHCLISRFCV